jgi:hypothetical protein
MSPDPEGNVVGSTQAASWNERRAQTGPPVLRDLSA